MRWRTGTVGTAAVAVLAAAVLHRRFDRFAIVDRSMAPALESGDSVIARRRRGVPTRGAVVVFPHPQRPGFDLVKRVVGLPGERIAVAGGQVAVDGRVVAEPWAVGPAYPAGSWSLGPGEVFVLGDDRTASADDSRMIGPVPVARAEWIVVARYRSLRTAGRVR